MQAAVAGKIIRRIALLAQHLADVDLSIVSRRPLKGARAMTPTQTLPM